MGWLTDIWSGAGKIKDGDPLDAVDVTASFTAVQTILNGGVDDSNVATGAGILGSKIAANSMSGDRILATTIGDSKLKWGGLGDPVKAVRSHAPYTKVCYGSISIVMAAASGTGTITFTGGYHGGTSFSSTASTFVVATVASATATDQYVLQLSAITLANCLVTLYTRDGSASAETVTVNWIAVGDYIT